MEITPYEIARTNMLNRGIPNIGFMQVAVIPSGSITSIWIK